MKPGLWTVTTSASSSTAELPELKQYAEYERQRCRTAATIAIDPFFLQDAMKENIELKGFTCERPVESMNAVGATLKMVCSSTHGERLDISSAITPSQAKVVSLFHGDAGLFKDETVSTYERECRVAGSGM